MKATELLSNRLQARLIPSFKRPERALLSVFMAVLTHCPSLRGELLGDLGYGSGRTARYSSFMEPVFDHPAAPPGRPDGMFCCVRGSQTWGALVEAKRDENPVSPEQMLKYIELAKFLDLPCVISISNELSAATAQLPYSLPSNKLRGREVFHWSWGYLTNQMGLFAEREDAPENEVLIISEALAYMLEGNSGVRTFDQMPQSWPDFVQSASTNIGFNNQTQGLAEIVHAWHQERRDLSLKLNSMVGGGVKQKLPRKEQNEESERVRSDRTRLANDYKLEANYDLGSPNASLRVVADLRACSITTQLLLCPPGDKQAKGTASWLVKKLEDAKGALSVVSFEWPGRVAATHDQLDSFLKHPTIVIGDQKVAPKLITLSRSKQETRRFKSRKRFIEDLENEAFAVVRQSLECGF